MFDSLFPKEWTTLQRLMWLKTNALARAVYETITGNPVSFTAKAAPLRQLEVAFSPVQSGSGDPSPDNVRPISGWSEVTVEQRGVNMWDEEWENGYWSRTTGAKYGSDSTYLRCADYIPCLPNTGYYFKSPAVHASSANYAAVMFYDSNKGYISYSFVAQTPTFTTPANAAFMTFYVEIGTSGSTYNHDISINYPATDHDYHAYNPASRSISISLGSTVYSGTVDVVTGVVTVTMAKVEPSGMSKDVTTLAGHPVAILRWDVKPVDSNIKSAMSNYLKQASYNEVYTGASNAVCQNFQQRLYASIDGVTNTASLNAWLADHADFYVVYELATPLTIQLTPQEVESLAGDNTMWTDGDSLTVEYRSN